MKVSFVSKTQSERFENTEALMIYCARVSSAKQDKDEYEKLLRYCINNGHWSVFEMADMTVEIETSRAIAQQILRHRSFSFQELSQRYTPVSGFEEVELRKQGDSKQGSGEVYSDIDFHHMIAEVQALSKDVYDTMLQHGVSRETARFILPLCTTTKMYMKGSVRSWIHYLMVRLDHHTQQEHRLVADEIKKIFIEHFPVTARAMSFC
jgi:thymidylate synthase (FAD)